ncbi:MAG: hypothetical protein ACRDJN_08760, partial [Chloroflexota bacterium]
LRRRTITTIPRRTTPTADPSAQGDAEAHASSAASGSTTFNRNPLAASFRLVALPRDIQMRVGPSMFHAF